VGEAGYPNNLVKAICNCKAEIDWLID